MSEKYSPSKGERVRIVLEGEVVNSQPSDSIQLGEGAWLNYINPRVAHVVSVEKLPDPIPTTPGTVLWIKSDVWHRKGCLWFRAGSDWGRNDDEAQYFASEYGFTVLRKGDES